MIKVLFTGCTFSIEEIAELKKDGIEIIPASADISLEDLKLKLTDCDVYIVGGQEIVNRDLIESISSNIKLITYYGIGTGNIDIAAAKEFGIPVTNTLKVSTYSVAEFTVGLILTLNKRIFEFDKDIRSDKWNRLEMFDLKGKTVGIVGMGSIGTYTARILKNAFDVNILYTDIVQKFNIEEELMAKKVTLKQLLKESDIVSLHAPLNDKTRNMLGKYELSLMKNSALLINTARAWLVDPEALYSSLEKNIITGAAFDGFYTEPVDRNADGGKLLDLPSEKFILTPHTGFNVFENPTKMKRMTIENIRTVLNGDLCPNLIR